MSPTFPPTEHHTFVKRATSDVLTPNDTQKVTLGVAAGYILVIALLWHAPLLNKIIYPFKLLVVGMHEASHAFAGVVTCAVIESIQLDPDEGGATRMRGGVPAITLPAGYLGSSLIGAALIACGFDINASKIATCALAVGFLITLWWARNSWIAWITVPLFTGLLALCWLIYDSVPLRFLVLFIGVMSRCLHQDASTPYGISSMANTIKRKVNGSDASRFAAMIGFFGPRVWGVIWLINSIIFFAGGILIGIAAFKRSSGEQREAADRFMGGTPG
ncbi:peptidase M50B-like-domain-containing protein [Filobasidium floriforme]|uniref:peptidase M50B-like-domain-containing protein n=1 Tax=Filobasidium floriforme TaxID=5210 RepID=UPI001E8EC762|nr:peptidase M50B-like-domain-containing protein [Filobasidium floriforme]KAH8090865.1 peptidase M50B-like-domain-containing protein [Filobasidium floriforme]